MELFAQLNGNELTITTKDKKWDSVYERNEHLAQFISQHLAGREVVSVGCLGHLILVLLKE